MDYYKILKFNRTHYGMKYKKGLNTDPLPFNPQGSCWGGGLYFSREDILAFLPFGSFVCKVTLPEGEPVYKDGSDSDRISNDPVKWKAHRIILGPFRLLTIRRIQKLIDEGADVNVESGDTLREAIEAGKFRLAKLLIKNGSIIKCDCFSERPYHKRFTQLLLNAVNNMPEADRIRFKSQIAYILHKAVQNNWVGIAGRILKSGLISYADFQATERVLHVRSQRMQKVILKYWGGPGSPYEDPNSLPFQKMKFDERVSCFLSSLDL